VKSAEFAVCCRTVYEASKQATVEDKVGCAEHLRRSLRRDYRSQVDFLLERVDIKKIQCWRLARIGRQLIFGDPMGAPLMFPPIFGLAMEYGRIDADKPEQDDRAGDVGEMHGRAITTALRSSITDRAVCAKLEEHMLDIEARHVEESVPAVIELPKRLVQAKSIDGDFLQYLFKTYTVKATQEITGAAVRAGNIELVELLMAKADFGEFKLDLGALERLAKLAETNGMREALKRKVWAASPVAI
jgi:hypothetical protein